MADGDAYITILVSLVHLEEKAVRIAQGRHQAWIPRSVIHGADDKLLTDLKPGEETKLRIMQWKAAQAGLVEAHAGQKELFG